MATNITRGGDGQGALIEATVFIVGGGSGMGEALASMAVARGAKVVLAGRNQEKLDRVADRLGNGVIGTHAVDISDASSVNDALAAHGPYDHIVTTAADLVFKPFLQLSDEDINRMLASKLHGPINLARAADQHLKATGSVLFFSGLAAYRQGEGASLVGAVNIALESLVANLAIEMKPKRFNVLSPGIVDSATWDGMSDGDKRDFFAGVAEGLPVGRVGHCNDIAHAALSILENGFIDGTVVHVDGGGRIA
jgi:NAD(P)-dependent dehydrogenase (short-subunit alcohol dehydrogenase family)